MVSVIVPVYNQGDRIQSQLNRLLGLAMEKEIIVVNDGSRDNTELILRELALNELKVIHHVSSRGRAAALRTGLEHARGEFVLVAQGNWEDNAAHCLKLLEAMISSGADIVLGAHLSQRRRCGWFKRAKNKFLTRALNTMWGVDFKGWFAHLPLIRRSSLLHLSPHLKGRNIAFQILAKGLRRKMRVVEVLIHHD